MKRLDGIIADVKAARGGTNHPWIYDDSGNVASGVICGDVLPLLESLKYEELDVTDEQVEELLAEATDSDNTYNWGANISNDLNFDFCKNVELNGEYYENIAVIMVHLHGDIRGGYSDYFVVPFSFDQLYYDFDGDIYQSIPINDRYSADVNIFSEGYTVYDHEKGEDIGEFYEFEVEDLLKEIAERTGDNTDGGVEASTRVTATSESDADVTKLTDQFFKEAKRVADYFRYFNKNLNKKQNELAANLSDAVDNRSISAVREVIANLKANTKRMDKEQISKVTYLYYELCVAGGKYYDLGRLTDGDNITGSTKYGADMCSIGASSYDNPYDENDELYKYSAKGYLEKSLRGLMDEIYSNDFQEVLDYAAEMSSGLYVELENQITGKSVVITPEDWDEASAYGEYPQSIYSIV